MPLFQVLACVLCVAFVILAIFHLYWAAGGRLGSQGAIPTIDDRPLIEPGPLLTIAVAAALIVAALVAAQRGGLPSPGLPRWFSHLGTWVLVFVFALRAIGDFRHVGFFKRVRGTLFARRDSRVYSPLCAAISALAAALAILAP